MNATIASHRDMLVAMVFTFFRSPFRVPFRQLRQALLAASNLGKQHCHILIESNVSWYQTPIPRCNVGVRQSI